MYYLLILISFLPTFLNAMEEPPIIISETEQEFLRRVLKVWQHHTRDSIKEKEERFKEKYNINYQQQKKSLESQLAQLKSQKQSGTSKYLYLIEQQERQLKREIENLAWQEKYKAELKKRDENELDKIKEEKALYDQFLKWRQRPFSTKLLDVKFLFWKMAAENNIDGMQAIEKLAFEWKLISNPDHKLEKLDYYDALQDAVHNGGKAATQYLLEKKNITLKNLSENLLVKVCNGNWGKKSDSWFGDGETQQKNIVQLMIKKGAPSSINNMRDYLLIARTTNAPERVIQYLEEVETSRKNS